MTDLLTIVPARGGSKRVAGKNLRLLAGRPLLAHTADAIREAGLDAPCLLTTDEEAIAAVGRGLGWMVPFLRPAELAADDAPTIDAVLHGLDWFAGASGGDPEAVMVLQPTSPLRGAECIKEALAVLDARPEVDSVVGMRALHLPPKFLFLAGESGLALALDPSDGRRPVYIPNGALYLARTAAVRRLRSLYAGNVLPLVMDDAHSVDVDSEWDFRLAEILLAAGLPPPAARPAAPSIG